MTQSGASHHDGTHLPSHPGADRPEVSDRRLGSTRGILLFTLPPRMDCASSSPISRPAPDHRRSAQAVPRRGLGSQGWGGRLCRPHDLNLGRNTFFHVPIAHGQQQAFLRPKPRRQARDQPRRAQHHQARARHAADHWPGARGSNGCRRRALDRCSSAACPEARSSETIPANSSGSPSGSASDPPRPRAQRPWPPPAASSPTVAPGSAVLSGPTTPP